jgi:hypothetical protein
MFPFDSRGAWRTILAVALSSHAVHAQVQQTWVAKYAGPNDGLGGELAFLPNGNIVVAGYFLGPIGQDFLTICYEPQGAQLWAQLYDGPLHQADEARGLAVDRAGNVIVGGTSTGTPSGSDHQALALCKYAPDGNLLWERRYERLGVNWSSWGPWGGLGIDDAGNVYVAGNSQSKVSGAWFDMVLVSWDANGQQRWVQTYNGPVGGLAVALDLAVTPDGESRVVGLSQDPNGTECITLAYAANGTLLWAAHEPDGTGERVALGSSGETFVIGAMPSGTSIGDDVLVLAYDGSGSQLWKTGLAGLENYRELPRAVRPGGAGDLYVTADTSPTNYPDPQGILTARLGPAGEPLWVRVFEEGGLREFVRDLDVDASGNVYVTGQTVYSDVMYSWSEYLTLKYAPSGKCAWLMRFGEPTGPLQQPQAEAFAIELAGDPSYLIVTGVSLGSCTTLRYDQPAPPSVYCTSQPSSIHGCTPSLGGSSSLASLGSGPGTCDVVCAPVPGGPQPAIAIASTGGELALPLATAFGWSCIAMGPAWFRLPASSLGGTNGLCDGLYAVDVGGWLKGNAGNAALAPGGTLDLQVWYRDLPNPAGANLSNALALDLVP